VGNVLRAKVVEQCIAEGVKSLDFLGEMTEHKRRWRATVRVGHDVFFGRPGLKMRLLFTAQMWPTGRYLRPVQSTTQ
jgi:CelD/BcsL family acetyltransferase involved in cellulose biosynthesis